MAIPVLMYHAIGDAATGTQEYDDANFTVTESQFRAQLQFLSDNNYKTLRLDQIAQHGFDQKAVVISFDDGHASDAEVALPILQEFGFLAEFFVTTDWVGKPGYMQPESIAALANAGMSVGSHGHTHRFFNDLSYAEAREELLKSVEVLQGITGQTVNSFSAPGGQLPAELEKLAKECGLESVCTSSAGTCSQRNFPLNIPRTAMRCDLSAPDFERIVSCDPGFYRQIQLRTAVLSLIRRSVGNDFYMGVREKVMQLRS